TMDFFWQLKRAIRALPKLACASYWNKAAGSTSRLSTRIEYVARIFSDFPSLHDRDPCRVWVSRTNQHWPAARAFSRHGASDEGARASAAQFVCRWTRSAFAGCWHSSNWLRDAETGDGRRIGANNRPLVASPCQL